jgi:hypothetical protein
MYTHTQNQYKLAASAIRIFLLGGMLISPTMGAVFAQYNGEEVAAAQIDTPIAFDGTAAEEEGYWYSRYNLGNLVMRSGLGEQFVPSMDMMQAMVMAVDANPDDGDTVMPPANAALLHAVYASGNPGYTQMIDPTDFGTQRWDPASFDTTITSRAMGWTIIKEIEWAKQFHVDDHFGTIEDTFGAQWRFVGMVMDASSKMQLQYALNNLMNADGLFANSDGTVDYAGNWVMLEALSDVGGTLGAEVLPHSSGNRYFDATASGMFLDAADMLFGTLADRQPADVEETSLAIQALTWYAANTGSSEVHAEALNLINAFGDSLAATDAANATETAFTIRGLIEAYRVSGVDTYLTAASAGFDALVADFNAETGIFDSQSVYTIDNVGVIMGALNSLKFYGGDALDQTAVEDLFTHFYLNAVNKSGLQQAVPPIPVAKGAFEQEEPVIFYGYPTVPMPPMAGGDFGIAPVFATEVSWDGSAWSVTNANFDSAGAMHASNEFIWFHNDEVNGFPEFP